MKNIILLSLLLFSHIVFAQVPQGIPYQAAARNASGQPLVNTAVKVRFSIIDSVATGTTVYQETHSVTTNNVGLFSVNVGLGTPVTGTFSGINWGQNFKFMKVELDPSGAGSNYVDMGTQQMMSVPYALYAGECYKLNQIGSRLLYFTKGTTNWLVPNGVNKIVLEAWAGGGGGGLGGSSSSYARGGAGGGGGSAGCYKKTILNVIPGSNMVITVGGGGNGATNTVSASNGQATTFGAVIFLAGGIAGSNGASDQSGASGVGGGLGGASTCQFNLNGNNGGGGCQYYSGGGGAGGNSGGNGGVAGTGGNTVGNGDNADSPGSGGGGGGGNYNAGPGGNGGAGADGLILIYY